MTKPITRHPISYQTHPLPEKTQSRLGNLLKTELVLHVEGKTFTVTIQFIIDCLPYSYGRLRLVGSKLLEVLGPEWFQQVAGSPVDLDFAPHPKRDIDLQFICTEDVEKAASKFLRNLGRELQIENAESVLSQKDNPFAIYHSKLEIINVMTMEKRHLITYQGDTCSFDLYFSPSVPVPALNLEGLALNIQNLAFEGIEEALPALIHKEFQAEGMHPMTLWRAIHKQAEGYRQTQPLSASYYTRFNVDHFFHIFLKKVKEKCGEDEEKKFTYLLFASADLFVQQILPCEIIEELTRLSPPASEPLLHKLWNKIPLFELLAIDALLPEGHPLKIYKNKRWKNPIPLLFAQSIILSNHQNLAILEKLLLGGPSLPTAYVRRFYKIAWNLRANQPGLLELQQSLLKTRAKKWMQKREFDPMEKLCGMLKGTELEIDEEWIVTCLNENPREKPHFTPWCHALQLRHHLLALDEKKKKTTTNKIKRFLKENEKTDKNISFLQETVILLLKKQKPKTAFRLLKRMGELQWIIPDPQLYLLTSQRYQKEKGNFQDLHALWKSSWQACRVFPISSEHKAFLQEWLAKLPAEEQEPFSDWLKRFTPLDTGQAQSEQQVHRLNALLTLDHNLSGEEAVETLVQFVLTEDSTPFFNLLRNRPDKQNWTSRFTQVLITLLDQGHHRQFFCVAKDVHSILEDIPPKALEALKKMTPSFLQENCLEIAELMLLTKADYLFTQPFAHVILCALFTAPVSERAEEYIEVFLLRGAVLSEEELNERLFLIRCIERPILKKLLWISLKKACFSLLNQHQFRKLFDDHRFRVAQELFFTFTPCDLILERMEQDLLQSLTTKNRSKHSLDPLLAIKWVNENYIQLKGWLKIAEKSKRPNKILELFALFSLYLKQFEIVDESISIENRASVDIPIIEKMGLSRDKMLFVVGLSLLSAIKQYPGLNGQLVEETYKLFIRNIEKTFQDDPKEWKEELTHMTKTIIQLKAKELAILWLKQTRPDHFNPKRILEMKKIAGTLTRSEAQIIINNRISKACIIIFKSVITVFALYFTVNMMAERKFRGTF